jgi:endonuclease/exonuclease/phosphatase (EEP) superfamily protein YafD
MIPILIVSDRAEAHPRVIEYNGADHENFPNLDEALKSMAQRNISDFDVTPECTRAWDSVPQSKKGLSYYAVAYGKTTGVFETWEYANHFPFVK